jgi:hypothetical protein
MARTTLDPDWRIRAAALRAVELMVARHGPTLPWSIITDLMGIRPDGVIELSQSLLDTRDGPTLEHAVKSYHGQRLHLPRLREDQPERRRLEEWMMPGAFSS